MYAESGGARIWYEDVGEGEPLVMIAGFGAEHSFWSRAPSLLKGYRIVTLDNRGVGRTEYSGHFDTSVQADDVIAVMDALGIEKAHILGWSMGSHIARNLAVRYPDRLVDLILIGTYIDRPARSQYVLDGTLRAVVEGRIPLRFFYMMVNVFCLTEGAFEVFEKEGREPPVPRGEEDPQGLMDQLNAVGVNDTGARDVDIGVPTLIIHGAEDIMVPPSEGRKAAAAIEGSEYVELPGQGHRIPLKAYSAVADEFFRRHPVH